MLFDYTFIALCLAAGSLGAPANEASTFQRRAFTIETGNATLTAPNVPKTCNTTYAGVAISPAFNVPAYCGRYLKITNTGGGLNNHGANNSLLASVVDTCLDCAEGDLGLDAAAIALLLRSHTGGGGTPPTEFSVEWHFCDEDGSC